MKEWMKYFVGCWWAFVLDFVKRKKKKKRDK